MRTRNWTGEWIEIYHSDSVIVIFHTFSATVVWSWTFHSANNRRTKRCHAHTRQYHSRWFRCRFIFKVDRSWKIESNSYVCAHSNVDANYTVDCCSQWFVQWKPPSHLMLIDLNLESVICWHRNAWPIAVALIDCRTSYVHCTRYTLW